MHRLTGAHLIMQLLERQGIDTLAGIPGGSNLPLYDALAQHGRIRHVLARHEQGAGFIAQGRARVTGQPAVCFATSGPGVTNVLTAIADAKLDSIPVVCISGQVPRAMIGTDAFQEVDTYGMTIPITKHNFLVRSAAELLDVIPAAFRIAASGRPGPVLVDVPKDVQLQVAEFAAFPEPGRPDAPPAFDPAKLTEAAALLNAAQRPVLFLGGGVIASGASDLARTLAERANLPTVMSLMGLGALPRDHALSLGMLGMHGARSANLALEECDLLLALGTRLGDRATGKVAGFCPHARLLHVDIDDSELDKIKPAHLAITGDVGQVLQALLPHVAPAERRKWRARVAELQAAHPFRMPGGHDPSTPYGLIRSVAACLDDSALIATDVGQHQMWTAQCYPFRRPRQLLTSGGLGTMGFGLPSAIGAALAAPDRTVVCFSGDGSLLMNIQELATAAEENVNVKVIVLDNRALGLVGQQQDLFYGRRRCACDFRHTVDYVRIAEGFGVRAHSLASSPDPRATLADALATPGPALIHAPIATHEKVYPMVPPGAANKDMLEGETHAALRA